MKYNEAIEMILRFFSHLPHAYGEEEILSPGSTAVATWQKCPINSKVRFSVQVSQQSSIFIRTGCSTVGCVVLGYERLVFFTSILWREGFSAEDVELRLKNLPARDYYLVLREIRKNES